MTRMHIHTILRDANEDEVATVTVTLDATDDNDAQEKLFALFPDHAMDITEIEEAE